jgi:putative ABC transport system permease protein
LLTETVLLAALGGSLGLGLAQLGMRGLVALSPPDLPRAGAIGLHAGVFLFALGLTTLVGVVVGLAPALQVSGSRDLLLSVQQTSRRSTGGPQWMRRALVVGEVGLSLVLLVAAGLLLHSLRRLFAVPPGFDAAHVLTMQVQTAGRKYDDPAARTRFFLAALEAAQGVPGVQSAAFTSLLPLSGELNGSYGIAFENGGSYDTSRYAVTPDYFATMGIRLRKGRFLGAHDDAGSQPVVVISESLAKAKFGSADPIGQRAHVGPSDRPWFEVVGVVGDVKQTSLAEASSNGVYLTPQQSWFADDTMTLVARTSGDPAGLGHALREAIWSVDKDQPVVRVAPMESLLAASEAQRNFALIVFEGFALVGLLLAATGIYGVLAGSVTDRLHEIGVRIALGASRNNIVALVVKQGLRVTLAGMGFGLLAAVWSSRMMASMLFEVSRLDPLTYVEVVVLLLGVAGVACALPAWRAVNVDPAATLRAE